MKECKDSQHSPWIINYWKHAKITFSRYIENEVRSHYKICWCREMIWVRRTVLLLAGAALQYVISAMGAPSLPVLYLQTQKLLKPTSEVKNCDSNIGLSFDGNIAAVECFSVSHGKRMVYIYRATPSGFYIEEASISIQFVVNQ